MHPRRPREPSSRLCLALALSLALAATACDTKDPESKSAASAPATASAASKTVKDGSLLHRSCEHEAKLGAELDQEMSGKAPNPEKLDQAFERCLSTSAKLRGDIPADDATFDRFLQCRLDAKDLNASMGCISILTAVQSQAMKKELDAKMGGIQAAGDAALERIRKHVEAGTITPENFALIEKAREGAGMGRFGDVLDDAHAVIEAGRVAPGTTLEISIHRGLGSMAPPLPPGDAAADLRFTDAETGRRIARISPTGGAVLSIELYDQRIGKLMRWWAQDPEKHDVELAIEPDPETPTFDAPASVKSAYALLELGGLHERPLLIFPDGKNKSAKQWLGR